MSLTLAALMVLLAPRCALGLSAQVTWSPVTGTSGYKIYVWPSGHQPGGAIDVGLKAPDADGRVRSVVTGLEFNATYLFAVTSYNVSRVESAFSNTLPLLVPATPTPTPTGGVRPPQSGGTPTLTPTRAPTRVPTAAPNAASSLDSYLCYKARLTSGSAPFLPRTVSLADEFGSASTMLFKAESLCSPVSESGQPLVDPLTQQERHKIRAVAPTSPQTYIRMIDDFGTHVVDLLKADGLLVPTGVGWGAPAAPAGVLADHYQCDTVIISAGTAKLPKGVQATVIDQSSSRLYDVKKPTHLCTPVNEDGRGINKPAVHLMCYKVVLARGERARGKIVGQIQTLNEFGPGRLDTSGETELCVPAVRTP